MARITVKDVVGSLRGRNLELESRAHPGNLLEAPVAWARFQGQGMTFQVDKDARRFAPWTDPGRGLVICSAALSGAIGKGPFLLVEDPKLAFVYAAALFAPPRVSGIHPTAVIHPEAEIGRDVSIGPNSVIGRCSIGEGTEIGALVYVGDAVAVGRNVRIHNGAQLGNEGIGAIREADGSLIAFPHFDRLVVEDDVWVGSGAELHRGVLMPTVIGKGTHIGSRSEVGHNCVIGRHVCLASGVIIAGSATLGDSVFVGCGAYVNNGVEVAGKVFVAAHATVMKSCLEAGITIIAPPSRSVGRLLGAGPMESTQA